MNNYKELHVWKRSIKLAVKIYNVTMGLPIEKKPGLISQMRRSAVSVPSNIAEGSGRNTDKEFSRFLSISYGSLCELETQLIISYELGFIKGVDAKYFAGEKNELRKMIYSLINKFSV